MNFSKKHHEYRRANKKNMHKTSTIILMLLLLPVLVWSQQTTNFEQAIKQKGYTATDDLWTFIPEMKTAAKALDKCSKTKCTLKDPIKDKNASAKKQIMTILSGIFPSRSVQKSMAQFEKKLLKNKTFQKKYLDKAFKKYPGYSFDAMSSRMGFYIRSMEHMEDDE